MTLSEDLRSAGVITYNTVKEVPYAPDETWGTFKGSFGTVYRATTKRFVGKEQVYAIKEIQAVSRKAQLMVAQEISFLRQFRHPNILELKEAYIIDLPGHAMMHGIHLVTTPWAPVSFHHFIEDLNDSSGSSTICSWFKPQELDPWPSIVRQCLNGLDYLHSQQPNPIRHKDIKPHNILLYADVQSSDKLQVRPVIIDFGISKEHIDGGTTANTGTYPYKAPEQMNKQPPTLASDVFSLGCCFALMESILRPWPNLKTVHEAAMGEGSCQFATNIALVNNILQSQREESAGSIDTGLEFFCDRLRGLVHDMLEEEPVSRPSAHLAQDTLLILESDLARFLDTPTLELCITLQRKDTELAELDLSKLKTDGDVLEELDRIYQDIARRVHGRFVRLHYKISAVNYVKFSVHDPDRPTVRVEEYSEPPKELTSYTHTDSLPISPLHILFLMKEFKTKKKANRNRDEYRGTRVRDRIPKKFGQSSMGQLVDRRRPVYGWGLEIAEELDRVSVTLTSLCIMLISSFVMGVVFSIWETNIHDAFRISAICVGTLLICFIVYVDGKTDRR